MKKMVLPLALTLSACAPVSFIVQQDPALVPQKNQPVAVVADQSSITARQLLPVLLQQMTAQGIDVVADPPSAAWVLNFTVLTQFDTTETKNSAIIAPGSTVHLDLVSADDFRAGRNKPVWSASSSSDPKVLSDNAPKIIGTMVQHYGQNYVYQDYSTYPYPPR
jgi:hypothetical protein